MKKVFFKNNSTEIAGILYFPDNMDENNKYSAIVITSAAGALKEQTSRVYAQRLSQNGFVVLTFDPSFQGESGGEPRQLENPFERVEDIRSSIDYLTTLPYVDRDKIGAFGFCAGAGYTVSAAITDRRIKAIAGVSLTDVGVIMREGWDQENSITQQIQILENISRQRTAEANGALPVYIPYVAEVVDDNTTKHMREIQDYFLSPRGSHPNYINEALITSVDKIFSFSAFYLIEALLTQPLVMIVGSKSNAFYLSERVVNQAASKDKELYIIDGGTHISLYDIQPYQDKAVDKLTEFFSEKL